MICSCIHCKQEYSARGIHVHVDRAHLGAKHYSSGNNGSYDRLASDAAAMRKQREDDYLLSPKTCKQCDAILPFAKRTYDFCSRSCSAKHGNARKDYTTFKPGPAKTKQPEQKICKNCNTTFSTLKSKKQFCTVKCASQFKNRSLRENRSALKNYRADCAFRFSLKDYPEEFDFSLIEAHGWYKAKNHGDNLTGVSRDHMVSVRYGFDNNLPPEHLSHPANCKLMLHSDNVSKNKNNLITYEELLTRIDEWNAKYVR